MKLPKRWKILVRLYNAATPVYYGRALSRKIARKKALSEIQIRKWINRDGFDVCASCTVYVRNRRGENFCHGCKKTICEYCAESQDHWQNGRHGLLIKKLDALTRRH